MIYTYSWMLRGTQYIFDPSSRLAIFRNRDTNAPSLPLCLGFDYVV